MLPSITPAQARLPRTYEAAREALAECQNIDECKEWSDKAAALASYAKQAEDETLLKMAARIKARATRRAGELLTQIEASGTRTDLTSSGQPSQVITRTDAAREAGMSPHQQKQAVRIAAIPEPEFERQVESQKPPTLSQLAAQGVKPRPVLDLKGRDPRDFNRALHFIAVFEDYAKEIAKLDVESGIAALIEPERAKLRAAINRIDAMHDRIITRI